MALQETLQPLLQKEMTRKEFLVTLGLGMASMVGFSSIIHFLTGKSVHSHLGQRLGGDYRSNSYGGGKK